jgi:solute carrier family 25 protein 14/30
MIFSNLSMAPAILRQASYGTIKFGTYYWLQGMLQKEGEQATTPGLARNVGCAVTAGVLASSIANPTDVLKVRMQADRSKTIRGGLIHCFMDIYHLEGIRGLWRVR